MLYDPTLRRQLPMMTKENLQDVRRSYTIAFSVRSGSNELCHLLSLNGLGAPSEHFQDLAREQTVADLDASREIFSIISTHTANAVFGSKMSHNHRARVDGVLRRTIGGYRNLNDLLPDHRWVWLIRRDKIAQAVSLCRAETSGVFATVNQSTSPSPPPSFDYYHVLSRVMMLCANDLAWQTYFDEHEIKPYTILYEDFFSDLGSSLPALVDYLGGVREHGALTLATGFAVQRDNVSAEWTSRFRHYLNQNWQSERGR